MTCAEAREAVLEADLSELAGTGNSNLARHLGACSRCRELAAEVLAGEQGLALELIRAVPELDLDHVLAAVTSTSRGVSGASTSRGTPGGAGSHGLPGAWALRDLRSVTGLRESRSASRRALAALALAAGLAALFLAREPTSLPGPAFAPAQGEPSLDLEVPPGWTAAVLATDDPNITVLWLFPRSDEI